jgi:RES domain-containing protein
VLYASSTLSLACLEILGHIKQPRLPVDYAYSRFDLAEEFIHDLDFINVNDEEACIELGTAWIEESMKPALRVPSVIISIEANILLNPKHADFHSLSVSEPFHFSFDPRLLNLSPISL